jgi:hypothetical protein
LKFFTLIIFFTPIWLFPQSDGGFPIFEITEAVIQPSDTSQLVLGKRFKVFRTLRTDQILDYRWAICLGSPSQGLSSDYVLSRAYVYLQNIHRKGNHRPLHFSIVSTPDTTPNLTGNQRADTLWSKIVVPGLRKAGWFSVDLPFIPFTKPTFFVIGQIIFPEDLTENRYLGPSIAFTTDSERKLTWVQRTGTLWYLNWGRMPSYNFNAMMYVVAVPAK